MYDSDIDCAGTCFGDDFVDDCNNCIDPSDENWALNCDGLAGGDPDTNCLCDASWGTMDQHNTNCTGANYDCFSTCRTDGDDGCNSNLTQGSCTGGLGSGDCTCVAGFYGNVSGDNCAETCNCLNGATCRDGVTGDGDCSCAAGYWEADCGSQCPGGGTSNGQGTCDDGVGHDNPGTGVCTCTTSGGTYGWGWCNYIGDQCSYDVDACGVCNGPSTGAGVGLMDCAGTCDPSTPQGIIDDGDGLTYGATLDDCDVCSGGESGHTANEGADCFGCCTEGNTNTYMDGHPNVGSSCSSASEGDPCYLTGGWDSAGADAGFPTYCATGGQGGRDICGICDGVGETAYYQDTDGDGYGAGSGTNYCPIGSLINTVPAVCSTDGTSGWCTNNLDYYDNYFCLSNSFGTCYKCDASDYYPIATDYTDNTPPAVVSDNGCEGLACQGCTDDSGEGGVDNYNACYLIAGSCNYPNFCSEGAALNYDAKCGLTPGGEANTCGNCNYLPTIDATATDTSVDEDNDATVNFTIEDLSTGSNPSGYVNGQTSADGVYASINTDPDSYITSAIITGSGANRVLTVVPVANASGDTAYVDITVINVHGYNTYSYNIVVSATGDPTSFSTGGDASLSANNSTPVTATATDWDYPYDGSSTLTLPADGTPTGVSYSVGSPTITNDGATAEWTITVTTDCDVVDGASNTVTVTDDTTTTTTTFDVSTANVAPSSVNATLTDGYGGDPYLLDSGGSAKSFSLDATATDTENCSLNYNWTKTSGTGTYSITNDNTANASVQIDTADTWGFTCTVDDGVNSVDSNEVTITLTDKTGCHTSNVDLVWTNPFWGQTQTFTIDNNTDAQVNVDDITMCTYTDCNTTAGFLESVFPTWSPDTITCPGGAGTCPHVYDVCGNCQDTNDNYFNGSGAFYPRNLTCSDYYSGAGCGTYNDGCGNIVVTCNNDGNSDAFGVCQEPEPTCTSGACECPSGVWSGDGSDCCETGQVDCNGVCGTTDTLDACGVCSNYTVGNPIYTNYFLDNGDDIDGTTGGSGKVYYNSSQDCNGICYDGYNPSDYSSGNTFGAYQDSNCSGTCVGGDTGYSCVTDCAGVYYVSGLESPSHTEDACGVCSNYTSGAPLGTYNLDVGTMSVYHTNSTDCNGVCYNAGITFGAYTDTCTYCVGGNTGLVENYADASCGCDVAAPVTRCEDTDGDNLGNNGTQTPYCESFGTVTPKTCDFGGFTSGSTDCGIPAGWVVNCTDPEPDCATNDTDNCGECAGAGAQDCGGGGGIYCGETGVDYCPGGYCSGNCLSNCPEYDECGFCVGGNTERYECANCTDHSCCDPQYYCNTKGPGCSDPNGGPVDCHDFVGSCDPVDDCDVCNGDNSDKVCSGACSGSALIDDCGICYCNGDTNGGTDAYGNAISCTDQVENYDQDCYGTCSEASEDNADADWLADGHSCVDDETKGWNESQNSCQTVGASIDFCGYCWGGGTGYTENYKDIGCGCDGPSPVTWNLDSDLDTQGCAGVTFEQNFCESYGTPVPAVSYPALTTVPILACSVDTAPSSDCYVNNATDIDCDCFWDNLDCHGSCVDTGMGAQTDSCGDCWGLGTNYNDEGCVQNVATLGYTAAISADVGIVGECTQHWAQDCAGNCDEDAFIDNCSECVGGSTGLSSDWKVDCRTLAGDGPPDSHCTCSQPWTPGNWSEHNAYCTAQYDCFAACRTDGDNGCNSTADVGNSCTGGLGSNTCTCVGGYYSSNCSGVCDCQNGGTCRDGSSGDGDCSCTAGYYGIDCSSVCPGFDGSDTNTICSGNGNDSGASGFGCDDGVGHDIDGTGVCTCTTSGGTYGNGYCTDDCSVENDYCGECGGNNVSPDEIVGGTPFGTEQDCTGTCGGSAEIDECGVCAGGTSGLDPNYQTSCLGDPTNWSTYGPDLDCACECSGTNVINACGYCQGPQSNSELTWSGYYDSSGSPISNYNTPYGSTCNFNNSSDCSDGFTQDNCLICSDQTVDYWKDCTGLCPYDGSYAGRDSCYGSYYCATGGQGGRDICGVCGNTGETTYCNDADGDGLGNPGNCNNYCDVGALINPNPDVSLWITNNSDTNPDYYCVSNTIDQCGVCDGDNTTFVCSTDSDFNCNLDWFPANNVDSSCGDTSCIGCMESDADNYDSCYINAENTCTWMGLCGTAGAENYDARCLTSGNTCGDCEFEPVIGSVVANHVNENNDATITFTITDNTTNRVWSDYTNCTAGTNSCTGGYVEAVASGADISWINQVGITTDGTTFNKIVTINPVPEVGGTATITITVTSPDGYGIPVTTAPSITVYEEADVPSIGAPSPVSFNRGDSTSVNIDVTDLDDDNSSLTVTAASDDDGLVTVSSPSYSTSCGANCYRYTSTVASVGDPVEVGSEVTITINASDDGGSSATPATFTVAAPNQAPTGVDAGSDQTVTVLQPNGADTVVTFAGSAATDADGDGLTYLWTNDGGIGLDDDTLLTPKTNTLLPSGNHTFTLTVNDGNGGTDQDTMTLIVNDVTGCNNNGDLVYSNPFSKANQNFSVDNYNAQANISATCTYTDCDGNTGFPETEFPTWSADTITCSGMTCPYVDDTCGNCGDPNSNALPLTGETWAGTFLPRDLVCADYYPGIGGASCGNYSNGCLGTIDCSSCDGLDYPDCVTGRCECTLGAEGCASGSTTNCVCDCNVYHDCALNCDGSDTVDTCGVCSNYTSGAPLGTYNLDVGTMSVYHTNSTDCNGVCYNIGDGTFGAYDVGDGCGCVGGNTGLVEGYCIGCIDPTICNYEVDNTIDDGSCATGTYTCVPGTTPFPPEGNGCDCANVCGGTAVVLEYDSDGDGVDDTECGCDNNHYINGDGCCDAQVRDCDGLCGGPAVTDACGVCSVYNGTASSFSNPNYSGYFLDNGDDIDGTTGGSGKVYYDSSQDCNGVCYYDGGSPFGAYEDSCTHCVGGSTTSATTSPPCKDPTSVATVGYTAAIFEDGTCIADWAQDCSGVCLGDNSIIPTWPDNDGDLQGFGTRFDQCSDDTSGHVTNCSDCTVSLGDTTIIGCLDSPTSFCRDDLDDALQCPSNVFDDCWECDGTAFISNNPSEYGWQNLAGDKSCTYDPNDPDANYLDCNCECHSNLVDKAIIDECGVCAGGNTGNVISFHTGNNFGEFGCAYDCFCMCFGGVLLDECGVCGGTNGVTGECIDYGYIAIENTCGGYVDNTNGGNCKSSTAADIGLTCVEYDPYSPENCMDCSVCGDNKTICELTDSCCPTGSDCVAGGTSAWLATYYTDGNLDTWLANPTNYDSGDGAYTELSTFLALFSDPTNTDLTCEGIGCYTNPPSGDNLTWLETFYDDTAFGGFDSLDQWLMTQHGPSGVVDTDTIEAQLPLVMAEYGGTQIQYNDIYIEGGSIPFGTPVYNTVFYPMNDDRFWPINNPGTLEADIVLLEKVRTSFNADLEDGDAIMAWIGGQSSLAIWSGTQFGLAENEWYVQVPGSFTQESYYGFSLFMLVSNSGTLNWGGAI